MLPASATPKENRRMQDVRRTGLLDAPPHEALDRITARASDAFGVPVALVSLIDAERQFFASRCGLDATETPRDVSFCGHAIQTPDETFVVEDATRDERFADNPLVTGEPVVVFYAGRPIRSRNGQPLGTLCLIDHTPRQWSLEDDERLAELARWTELEIQTIADSGRNGIAATISRSRFFDTSQDIFAVATADGKLLDANRRLGEQFGYPITSMLGRSLYDIVHPLDDAASRVFLDSVVSSGATGPFINRLRRADGAFRAIEWTCSTHDGLIYAAARDVTDRERQATHARTIHKALANSNRDLRDFASFTAHELRAPLRTIAGFVGIIGRRCVGDPELEEAAMRVVRGTRRMDALINDMLQLSKINNDPTPNDAVELDTIRDAVGRSIHASHPDADIKWDECPALLGNPSQLIQLFLNIIENGAKYQPAGQRPSIRVATSQHRGRVRFAISDNGVGIPEGLQSTIFEPFRRGHSHDEFEGTGIGLAMCKKIVQAHGGRIVAHADAGHGSTFTFDLPLLSTSAREVRGQQEAQMKRSS